MNFHVLCVNYRIRDDPTWLNALLPVWGSLRLAPINTEDFTHTLTYYLLLTLVAMCRKVDNFGILHAVLMLCNSLSLAALTCAKDK